jgi:sRNA-binding regulator protein Hfq
MENDKREIEYYVVYDADLEGLTRQVNIYLCGGWELQGGVSIATFNEFNVDTNREESITRFAQAMIRRISEEESQ